MKDIYRYSTEIIDNDELYKDEQPSVGEIFTLAITSKGIMMRISLLNGSY